MFVKTGYFQPLYSIAEVLIPVFSPIYLMVPAPSLQTFVDAALPPLDVPKNNIYFSGGVLLIALIPLGSNSAEFQLVTHRHSTNWLLTAVLTPPHEYISCGHGFFHRSPSQRVCQGRHTLPCSWLALNGSVIIIGQAQLSLASSGVPQLKADAQMTGHQSAIMPELA